MRFSRRISRVAILSLLAGVSITTWSSDVCVMADSGVAPVQPSTGFGGREYQFQSVTKTSFGEGERQFWLYEPANPVPKSAPVVVLLHGWIYTNPGAYGAWISHLVRHGSVVIVPRIQVEGKTRFEDSTAHIVSSITQALAVLKRSGHVKPDSDSFTLVGHSLGGLMAINLAANYNENHLPTPTGVMCIFPGGTEMISLADLSKLPVGMDLVVVNAENDSSVSTQTASDILKEATKLAANRKVHIMLRADSHGTTTIVADHLSALSLDAAFDSDILNKVASTSSNTNANPSAGNNNDPEFRRPDGPGPGGPGPGGGGMRRPPRGPMGPGGPMGPPPGFNGPGGGGGGNNQPAPPPPGQGVGMHLGGTSVFEARAAGPLQWYGLWKTLDYLMDQTTNEKDLPDSLINSNEFQFMGKWTDGTPVKPMTVSRTGP